MPGVELECYQSASLVFFVFLNKACTLQLVMNSPEWFVLYRKGERVFGIYVTLNSVSEILPKSMQTVGLKNILTHKS